jgi:multiple sugar transport system substrate-binding protein
VTLTFWKTFEDSQHMDVLFQEYRKLHPNVTIEYTKKNVETYEQDLLNALAAGQGPDVFSIHNTWLPKYLDKVQPASSSVYTFSDYKRAFVDVAVSDFTKDQVVYGVPLSVDSLALYYNKDLLGSAGIATPPKTWDELTQDVQRLKRQDRTGYFAVSGVALGTNANVNRAVDIMYLFMLQQGVQPYSPDGDRPTFAQGTRVGGEFLQPGQTALTYYTAFSNPLSPNYNWNAASDYSIDAFANGRAAMLYSYSYTRDTIVQKSPNLNFDVAPAPQPTLQQPAVNFSNYWGEVVSKQSPNAAVAWDFLKFISGKDALDKYYAAAKQPSSRRDLIELQLQDPDIGVFAAANLTAKSFYRPNQQVIDDIIGKMIDAVVLRGLEPDQALSQAEQQASAIGRGSGR